MIKWSNWKWKIPNLVLRRRTLCFSSYKNRKLKVKLWWAGAREWKKRAFFVMFILSEGNFCNICVLSQCIVYWMHFQKIHTFTYKKILLHTLLLLAFKIINRLECILKFSVYDQLHIKWLLLTLISNLKVSILLSLSNVLYHISSYF